MNFALPMLISRGNSDVKYVYGVSAAMLLAGAATTLVVGGQAGAQTAVNERPIAAAAPRAGAPMSFADLTEQLQPAVVNISTTQKVKVSGSPFAGTPFEQFFGNQGGGQPTTREAQSLGSGFIISADGYIVTNNHVVAPGDRNATIQSITVIMPDRTEYDAKLVGRDAASDIAVLKISAPKPLPFVRFGDSSKSRVGDWIIAIGNPFGLGGTVTSGIISAIHRNTGQGGAYDRYLQTDASINRGNSGGPMFDLNGNVVGINNAIISPTGGSVGIGFAIPAEVAAPIVAKLRSGQTIERGYLGVGIQPLGDDLAASLGLPKNRGEFVQTVEPGEAADKAGLKPGDVVVAVNGKDVNPDQTLSFLVANAAVGENVPLDIIRDGKQMRLTAKLGKRPTEEEFAARFNQNDEQDFGAQPDEGPAAEAASQQTLGLAVVELTPAIARQVGAGQNAEGVVVSAVDPNGDAAQKGIRRGDVILSINRTPVRSSADLAKAVNAAKQANREAVLMRVQRRSEQPQFIPIKLRET
ncbi:MAG: Do family serine endopeptidase [Parasphingorhabdus sp.]|nr:Do family serine endopeptidase [Parasphingorhabdus sp.]